MRSLLAFLFLLFNYSMLFAQHDSGKATFHVVSANAKNSISFFLVCQDGYRELVLDNKSGAFIYWGRRGNPTSASFSADTAAVDTVKSIITPAFFDFIKNCMPKCKTSDSTCKYCAYLYENGSIKYSADIYADCEGVGLCYSERLIRLEHLLDNLYMRYAFPK